MSRGRAARCALSESGNARQPSAELQSATDQPAAEDDVEDRQLAVPAVQDEEAADRQHRLARSTTPVSMMSTVTAAISPITPAATPSRMGCRRSFSATVTSWRLKEDRKRERRNEDADGHHQSANQASGDVADEGREDDQRGGEDATNCEAVDELTLGEPLLPLHRDVVEVGDHGEGAAESDQAGLDAVAALCRAARRRQHRPVDVLAGTAREVVA